MISIFFNERGYVIESDKDSSLKIFDLPERTTTCATALYTFRWYVLNEALSALNEMMDPAGKELILYTDSRIVEELNGEIRPDDDYAKRSRAFYISHDLPRFKIIRVEKCPHSTIERKLNASKTIA